jgi:hypothetical protein
MLVPSSFYVVDLGKVTYAAVTANTSVLFASVNIVKSAEIATLKAAMIAILFFILSSRTNAMIDNTGSSKRR